MLSIALLLLFAVLGNMNSQFVPLRLDSAIDRLHQYEHFSPLDQIHDLEYDPTPEQMLHRLSLSLPNNGSSSCEHNFELILRAAMDKETWGLKVLDAWGKPLPSGILKGNVYWVGNYDECVLPMYNSANKSFMPQPVDTQYSTFSPSTSRSASSAKISLVVGLCVPSSCDRPAVASLLHTLFRNISVAKDNIACSNEPANGQKGLTAGAIATIVILSLLGLLVFTGTAIDLVLMSKCSTIHHLPTRNNAYNHLIDNGDVLTEPKPRPTPRIVFLGEFSALKSLRRIFTLAGKSGSEKNDSFVFINGIRVLSLFSIIIAHSLLFGLSYTSNIIDIMIAKRNILFQLISSAQFSVDTFFVISGFLTAILFVRQVKKENKLSFRLMFLYYVHRYIRLTPTFLLMVLVSINLTPYFGRGPVYPREQGCESKGCRTRSWWTSIFYLGNLVAPKEMCLNIAWYLHNDMQFHWIAPLTLIPFALGRKTVSFVIAMAFIFITIGSVLFILLHYPDMALNDPTGLANNGGPSFYETIYIKPWCRISAYAIGLLTGYIVIISGRQYQLNRRSQVPGTILALVIGSMCLFATYPDSIRVPDLSRLETVAYISLSRTLWSAVIGWLLFLCSTDQGGIVSKILSWSLWTPLARLNYSCYLTHSTILHMMIFNQTMPFYYQGYLFINNFIAQIFFSYAAAILVSVFFETPFFILERKVFKR